MSIGEIHRSPPKRYKPATGPKYRRTIAVKKKVVSIAHYCPNSAFSASPNGGIGGYRTGMNFRASE
jgi:hypothetical protein